jgi:VWFA-related protein
MASRRQWIVILGLTVALGWIGQQATETPAAPQARTQAEGQAPPTAPGVIRTEANLVVVDVIAQDKKQNYIKDLDASEFHVFEDDKEQPITTFSRSSEAQGTQEHPRYLVLFFDNSTMNPTEQTRARQAAAQFVEKAASAERMMAVVDFGGMFKVAQNFTADAAALKRAVGGVKFASLQPNEPGQTTEIAQMGRPSMVQVRSDYAARSVLLAIRNLAKTLKPIAGRKTLILFSGGFPLNSERQSELTATIDAANKANVAIYPIDVRGLEGLRPMTTPDMQQDPTRRPIDPAGFPTGAEVRDGEFPHETILLAASPFAGLALPKPLMQRPGGGGGAPSGGGGGTAGGGGGFGGGGGSRGGGGTTGGGTAGGSTGGSTGGGSIGGGSTGGGTRGGTTTGPTGGAPGGSRGGSGTSNNPYGQPGYGTYPRPGGIIPPLMDNVSSNQQILAALATGTGGFTIFNTNDFLEGLTRISQELDEYYVLGYVPPSQEHDGSFHRISVKVDRKGIKLRFRNGYYDVKSPDLLAGKPEGRALEEVAESPQPGEIPVTLKAPYFYTEPHVARVNLAVEIPAQQLAFEKEKSHLRSQVNVLGIAYREDGSVGARFSDTVKLDLEKKELKEFSKGPFFYENSFNIAPGNYKLKLVMSTGGQKFGKLEMPLAIEPFDGKMLHLSGVALSNRIQPVSEITAGIEAELLEERTPLVVKGMQLIPSPNNRFKKTEKVGIYLEVYEPMMTIPRPPRVGVIYNVIDLRTNQQVYTSNTVPIEGFAEKENTVIPVGLILPTEQLQAGQYRLEVRARNGAGHASPLHATEFVLE